MALLILFRLPYFYGSIPQLSSDIERLLVGEKLNLQLGLYTEIFTQIAPLSALVYRILDGLSAFNIVTHHLLSGFLILLQAWYFVVMIQRRNLLNDKNYIPGLVYIVVCHASFEFMKLSPALMANFFVLFALNAVLRQIEQRDQAGEDVFEAGLYIGLATLFQISNFLLIFWALASLFLFTRTSARQGFMVILAFILPLFLAYLFFYFNGNASGFTDIWLFNLRPNLNISWQSFRDVVITYAVPFAVACFGIIRILRGPRYNSFQNRAHQILLLFGVVIFITLFIANDLYPSALFSLNIPIAFFVSGFFIHERKMFVPEVLFIIFLGTVLGLFYSGGSERGNVTFKSLDRYRIQNEIDDPEYAGKRLLITGERFQSFKGSQMATGYLSWNLAKRDFKNPNNFYSITSIYNNFKKDMPEIIIDNEKVMPAVFKNLPELAKKYTEFKKGRYKLIK